MTAVGIFILAFTGLRLLVVLANLLSRQWLKAGSVAGEPLVSVLIPVRNEEKNLSTLLQSLADHDYKNLEIIVYDDLSNDNSWEIIQQYTHSHTRIKAVKGYELPGGWLGKNHACHNLALKAKGDYLLFLDADVRIRNGLIKNAVAHLQKHNLKLFSLFPVQITHSWPERLTVPLMNWILVSLLPLLLTRVSKRPSLSAANGQFMLFEADTYRKEQLHQRFRNQKVEDIIIFRYMKKQGYRVHTMLGNKQVSCRMYDSWDAAVQGFSKNVFEFFGGSRLLAVVFGLVTTFGFLGILLSLPLLYSGVYFVMVVLLRGLVSVQSRQNILINVFCAPMQQSVFLYVTVKAIILQRRKATLWKGRNIDG